MSTILGNPLIFGTTVQRLSWHQCPEIVRNYLDQVTYGPSDYSTSRIAEFAPATAVQSNTKPIGKTVDGVTYYNEVPNVETPFSSENVAGTLKPLDKLRWINSIAKNVRDLGGWQCDGGTVKYGMLFRGGKISESDRDILVNECGVRAELSLVGNGAQGPSILGSDIFFCCADSYNWYSLVDQNASTATWVTNLQFLFDKAKYRIPIYFHCLAGADRTGTFACIVEAILGMAQSDIDKEYELTSFSVDKDEFRQRNQQSGYSGLISEINNLYGTSFKQKVINWVGSLGFTEDDVNTFRKNMIDGNPPDVHFETQIQNLVTSYENNKRFSSSEAFRDAPGLFVVTNYIERPNRNDVFRIKINGASASDLTAMLSNGQLYIFEYYSADGVNFTTKQYQQSIGGSTAWAVETGVNGDPILVGYSETTKNSVPWVYGVDTTTTQGWNYFRIGLVGNGADCVITRNQPL